jgi:hypothetical protein
MKGQPSISFFRKLGLIGVALVLVGALLPFIWMYSVKQELLWAAPPYSQDAEKARRGPIDIQANFRGDLIGYAISSIALRSIRPENRVPLMTLANAEMILNRDSNFSGNTPEYLNAFDSIGKDPAALLAFRELVLNATPAGRIYGFCGLYLKRSSASSLAREHLVQSSQSLVWFKSGYDVFERRDTRELARRPEYVCRRLEKASRAAADEPRASSGRLAPHAEAP